MSEAATTEQAQPTFNIEKLYVKDLSLEVPHAPSIFLEREAPQIDLQLNTEYSAIDAGIYEVIITITLTAKLTAKDKIMFLIEAKQAGIFHVQNIPSAELEPVLGVVCPNILYPYLREVVTDVSVRAGFAPVLLNPVNFEALYQQQQQAQAAAPATKH
ncbi:MAG: protein-export chaperone SecB [Gallionellales bacterium 35-53-114]|jgi:preprotein translocase subunit SecB|nr:MAG: protein-export chaperone SecB [Gallionellales bacterium 35-53-114]OYZ64403.1 MAG: protein-export chaperone SecB [Gallionellales bacterium 24-53-125]OZB10289.1 MAG: protein-export chaperone SecB [Gallionellales bacterium 39-52-133]HQS56886.1 protein-export chaperone SecB [Gallionellaceae bacterium]HQS75330.1 protein-export chaperone SecB [Gallionellaceae bacterium]